MTHTCRQCSLAYAVTPFESQLRTSLHLPLPEQCPECRQQQRLSFRNFFHLHHRSCSLTGQKVISMYREDVPFPVYAHSVWRSDRWSGLEYGREIDWSQAIFPQIAHLHRTVPRMSLVSTNCENSDYCNMAVNTRNSYLVFGCVGNEDCLYGHIVWKCQDCLDCLYCYECIRCFECVDCTKCHTLTFSYDCENCSDSTLLRHCSGCRNCFGCVGLRGATYAIFNQQYSPDEYQRMLAELRIGNRRTLQTARTHADALLSQCIVKSYHGFNCDECSGDYLYNSRRVFDTYDVKNSEDAAFCATGDGFIDCVDCNFCGQPTIERSAESVFVQGREIVFSHNCPSGCARLWYCDHCFSCQDCFGCEGLQQQRYCIFNRRYEPHVYEEMLPRLIHHMRSTGEFGQFFPVSLSPFSYNESIAIEHFPLSKHDVLARGWQWFDDPATVGNQYMGPHCLIPDDIRDASDDLLQAIFPCSTSGRLYKILPQELQFFRAMDVPLPTQCFMERQRSRFALRNPRTLFSRSCAKCSAPIQTTYSPDRPEIVYCEECYLKTVY